MACDKTLLTHAYIDRELDPAATLEIEAHIGGCAACRQLIANMTELREALRTLPRHRLAAPGLLMRVRQGLDGIDAEKAAREGLSIRFDRFLRERRQWLAGAVSGAAVAAAVAVALVTLQPAEDDSHVIDELASAHLRSLMAQHLLDIGSSDAKTVSPWFKGRVDVSPPVVDLSAEGFDLEGGRADFVDGKRVAAIVYSHGAHVVNLFVWSDYEGHPSGVTQRDGYNLVMWARKDLVFCAVSDMGVGELKTLAHSVNAGAEASND